MSRPTTSAGQNGITDPSHHTTSPSQMSMPRVNLGSGAPSTDANTQPNGTGVRRQSTQGSEDQDTASQTLEASRTLGSAGPSPAVPQQPTPSSAAVTAPTPSTSLSGLVCNVHRTTGREPYPLVGATTTILGDKLYVFGGRLISRTRPQLTSDLFELDLIRRHWSKVEAKGDIPPPRYFHSVCTLGDSKLVCYGGMSPVTHSTGASSSAIAQQPPGGTQESQNEVIVMSDIHIYDVNTHMWTYIPTADTPQGRYAHCATVLPSSGVFCSSGAPLSAMHHNPASPAGNPNHGSIGVALDGAGGAEMVVVGGQDSANHYIEQISVFNLRSLTWTATESLGKSCGAYRSVVAPLTGMAASKIGRGTARSDATEHQKRKSRDLQDTEASMLIYSNYNFLDVKLELQVRLPDGTLTEKPMRGHYSPPGLRFPNGAVIDRHFVVSGTYLTSSKQEYALWALDLATLTWSRIDAGGNHFSQGSWNRGILWRRRNMFVVLGNRKRSLVEDYNHRRINFSNICMVELEAFGMYDNPRTTNPMSGFVSASSPLSAPSIQPNPSRAGWIGGGRPHSTAAEDLGRMASSIRELADMDLLAVGGERVSVNSRILARRWGPYFIQLLKEGAASATADGMDGASMRPHGHGAPSRASSVTITPSIGASSTSTATTLTNNHHYSPSSSNDNFTPPNPQSLVPMNRPRTLYLPHTHLTLQTLVHYLYTSALPSPYHPLCTPQILCSLLQIARPYQIDGLLEAVVERLHEVLDGRNAAAVFNAAAMAAGGGLGSAASSKRSGGLNASSLAANHSAIHENGASNDEALSDEARRNLRINTSFGSNAPVGGGGSAQPRSGAASTRSNNNNTDDDDVASSVTSTSTNTTSSDYDLSETGLRGEREVWAGEVSAVVGLQKRGLRGLMEGRRMRERGRSQGGNGSGAEKGAVPMTVGLGIA
ncbi:MAG: hypothetical protein M1833_005345 [Piccolia ochrophora]|nr:MAG: hypothetical protein M1833_005345 [Piccolia ochrophora]